MPARSRKGGFNLLSSPQPIVDDDDDETSPPAASGAASPLPKPQVVPEPEPEERKVEAAPKPIAAKPAAAKSAPSPVRPGVKAPPGTIRLNQAAGTSLWDEYLEAKTADPFLSYRQFASDVVKDGLAARRRRAK